MMAKATYALLIYRSAPGVVSASDERVALEGHRALQAQAEARGQIHAVARLGDTRDARTVTMRAGAHEVTDGPYIEIKEWLIGFYLIDCANLEEALARARMLCPVEAHTVEVRPVTWRWKP